MRRLPAGSEIDMRPGQRDCAVHFIRSGVLRVQRTGADGRRQILGLILPGELAMDEIRDRPDYSVEAATDVEFCSVDRDRFEAQLRRAPALSRAVVQWQSAKLERLRWMTWALGTQRPEERLCAFLAFATRFMPVRPAPNGGFILQITLSRQDIADFLGTTVETISRVSRRLDREGLIEIRSPGEFCIPSLDRIVERGAAQHFVARPEREPKRRTVAAVRRGLGELAAGGLHAQALRGSAAWAMTLVNAGGLGIV